MPSETEEPEKPAPPSAPTGNTTSTNSEDPSPASPAEKDAVEEHKSSDDNAGAAPAPAEMDTSPQDATPAEEDGEKGPSSSSETSPSQPTKKNEKEIVLPPAPEKDEPQQPPKKENEDPLYPGYFKMNDDISDEAKEIINDRAEYYEKYWTYIYSPLQYYTRVMKNYIEITRELNGAVGLALLPINFFILIFTFILKVFILNPPFTACIQSTIRFEAQMPIKILPPMTFKEGFRQANDLQMEKAAPTSSKFFQLDGVWYESLVLAKIRFPLLSLPTSGIHSMTENDDEVYGHWPLWCLHPFAGFALFQRHAETNQIYVCAEFRCWGFLRSLYCWMCTTAFETYIKEMKTRSEEERVFSVQEATV